MPEVKTSDAIICDLINNGSAQQNNANHIARVSYLLALESGTEIIRAVHG